MPLTFKYSSNATNLQYKIEAPEWDGDPSDGQQNCQIFHGQIALASASYLLSVNHQLAVLEWYISQTGGRPGTMGAASAARCFYIKAMTKLLTQAKECPHVCEKTRRFAGHCWKYLDS